MNYIAHCLISGCPLLFVEFSVAVLVKEFGDHVVTVANKVVAVQIERDVRDLLGMASGLQLRVCLHFLTVGLHSNSWLLRVLPPGGHLDGFIAEDVRAVITELHLVVFVEAKLVDSGWLVHDWVEWRFQR